MTGEKKKEDWMNSKWRPAMGWMYMAVCAADFMIFPVLWSILQSVSHGTVNTQWQPITLQGAGLFHLAMGAVLGIAAYGRTQEKLGGANNGGLSTPTAFSGTATPGVSSPNGFASPSAFAAPAAAATGNFGYPAATGRMGSVPAAGGFGIADNSTAATTWQSSQAFSSLDSSQAPPVGTGFGGKSAPPPMEFPER